MLAWLWLFQMTALLLPLICLAFVNVIDISWFLIGGNGLERINDRGWRTIWNNDHDGGILLLGDRVVAANRDRPRRPTAQAGNLGRETAVPRSLTRPPWRQAAYSQARSLSRHKCEIPAAGAMRRRRRRSIRREPCRRQSAAPAGPAANQGPRSRRFRSRPGSAPPRHRHSALPGRPRDQRLALPACNGPVRSVSGWSSLVPRPSPHRRCS